MNWPDTGAIDHCRDFFLELDGIIYGYETGHWYKVDCRDVRATSSRPAGLKYSLAFFDPAGICLARYDNSHAPLVPGRPPPAAHDHWHRSGNGDSVPYRFRDVETLLTDFFAAIDAHLPSHLRSA